MRETQSVPVQKFKSSQNNTALQKQMLLEETLSLDDFNTTV